MTVIHKVLYLNDFAHKQNLDSINLLWRAIMSMDILETYILLEDDYNYFNLTKNEFVRALDGKFKKHKFLNDDEFYLSLYKCYKCHKDETTCQFVGRESGIGMSIYFEIKNYKLTGIEFCDAYGKVQDLNEYYDWGEE